MQPRSDVLPGLNIPAEITFKAVPVAEREADHQLEAVTDVAVLVTKENVQEAEG